MQPGKLPKPLTIYQSIKAKMQLVNIKAQYQYYKQEINEALQRVLASGEFIGGQEIAQLEAELASFCGAKNAICCSSGTDALLLALLDADIKAGDEIILPAFTFVATAEIPVLLGAKPVFVDIELKTGLLDPHLIEAAISNKTRAIIPVSLFGQPPAMDEIQSIARHHHLTLIEDGAQSFGANYKDRYSCNLSPYGCTSFYPAKPLGCYGDGGAVFTNDNQAATRIRQLINHGQAKQYEYQYIGINARMDTIQAALLRVKLKYYKEEIRKRRELAAHYDKAIANTELQSLQIPNDYQSIYAQYSIYATATPANRRDQIVNQLNTEGIPTAIYYPKPLHLHKAYSDYYTPLPNSEEASRRIFSIPIHAFLTASEQEKISYHLSRIS